MYFLFTEKIHFLNLFNGRTGFVLFLVYIAAGVFLRCATEKRKEFYTFSLVAFLIWLACEIATAVIAAKDQTNVPGIMDLSFRLGWVIFCVLSSAWLCHLICFLLHKKKLE